MRRPIFDAVRAVAPADVFNKPGNIALLDECLDRLGVPKAGSAARVLANPEAFFAAVRKVTGPLKPVQVSTINGLLAGAAHWPVGWLAYGLATAWHEARFEPVPEIGRGAGKIYGKPGKYGQAQYGRGLVQLTWDANYEWADKELSNAGLIEKGALLRDFDLALKPALASAILVKGMEQGAFAGDKSGRHSLARHIRTEAGTEPEFTAARRIINGTDRAALIAGHALRFRDALIAGGWR